MSYPEREPVVLVLFQTIKEVILSSTKRIPVVISYVPRTKQTTDFFHQTVREMGFEFCTIPYTNYMKNPPLLGAQIYLLNLK